MMIYFTGEVSGSSPGWPSSAREEHRTPELRVGCLGACSPGMGDLLGGKKRLFVPVDHRFRLIFLCNFKKNDLALSLRNNICFNQSFRQGKKIQFLFSVQIG